MCFRLVVLEAVLFSILFLFFLYYPVYRCLGICRQEVGFLFILFRNRLVELIVLFFFVFFFWVSIEVRLGIAEDSMSLCNGVRTGHTEASRTRTWVINIFVALWAALILAKKKPTSSSPDRRRLGLNTVDRESEVI